MLLAFWREKQVWNNKTGDIKAIKLKPLGFVWTTFIETSSEVPEFSLEFFRINALARSTRLFAAIQ
jgi:hypothetical protein